MFDETNMNYGFLPPD